MSCVVAFGLTLVAAEARAADEGPVSLTLAESLARAEAQAPEVIMAGHELRDAAARRVGAGLILPSNPRLSVDARPVLRGGSLSDVGYAATADMLFEPGGAPRARVEEADRFKSLAQSELRIHRLSARARAFSAYLRALIAEQRVRESRAAVELGERVLSASRDRADAGASGDIERSLAESELGLSRASLSAEEQRQFDYVMDLRDAMDLPADTGVTLTTPLTDPQPVPPPATLVPKAVSSRADLDTIRRRIDLLLATETRLERETFPKVGGYVGVDATPLSPMVGIVGVSVELPVAQRNQGPLARTAAQRTGEEEHLVLEARRIVREVYATHAIFEARRRELGILTITALPAAERTLVLVESGWRSGRFDIFRVVSAARDLARVRTARLDALETAWLARIAIDRAVGGLEP
ncbi:MAG: TolC family protein [Myxococcales bacterium]|nr:TolC family protein [Myxococcales bacterium]